VVLPEKNGTFVLTYTLIAASRGDVKRYFVDARTGAIVLEVSEIKRETPAVGLGTGVLKDPEKLSAASEASTFVAKDLLRPALVSTFDMKGNLGRVLDLFNGVTVLTDSDLAASGDNLHWTDGPVVDAHAYAGFVYDYYFKRFSRHSWDDNNIALPLLTHPAALADFVNQPPDIQGAFYVNAFYCCTVFGHEFENFMVFGDGLPEGFGLGYPVGFQKVIPLDAGLDIVGHEMSHGMTAWTSSLDSEFFQPNGLLESGGLNESFSDQMGKSIQFYFKSDKVGDYVIGDEAFQGQQGAPSGIRDMANPGSFGDPDNVRAIVPARNNEVHSLAGIPNQAFYLAIEGGTNRTSGLAVTGVGRANRDQIEKVRYRAFQFMLTPTSGFHDAAVASVASAIELYGAGSAAAQAEQQAWTAVGVLP
jgi:thermolysin